MTRIDANKLANCEVIDLFGELSERDKSYNDRLVALANELRKLNKEKALNISELAELSGISIEPCEDCISRESALQVIADNNITGEILLTRYDAIIKGLYELPSVQPKGKAERNGKFYKDAILRESALRIVDSPRSRQQMVNMLEYISSVQPESRWIPCSERLPEESGDYLLCRPHFWGENIGQITVCYFNGEEWSDNYKCDAERFLPIIYGMAWMPLPEAYRGE